MRTPRFPPLAGPPLGWQLVAMLVCTLVAAQLVTLALTLLLPPHPPRQWNLDSVATALAGHGLDPDLEQARLDGPPDVEGTGWLISQTARQALARQLGKPEGDIVLAFYTQLPVGGVAIPARQRVPFTVRSSTLSPFAVPEAHAQGMPGGPGGGFPGGPLPNVGFPGGTSPGGFPGGMPGGGYPGGRGGDNRGGMHGPGPGGGPGGGGARGNGASHHGMPTGPVAPNPAGNGPALGATVLGQLRAPLPHDTLAPDRSLPDPQDSVAPPLPAALPSSAPRVASHVEAAPLVDAHARAALPPMALPATALPTAAPRVAPSLAAARTEKPQAIPFRSQPQGLLDRATPPFIEGDFIAAVRRPDGHWVAVAPRAEPFPNRWQKQVLLWFILSLVIVSPLAWFFARRIVLPLEGFARAAEMLGRDPSATIIPLSGPAEIGRAAHAFNQMHNRLRAFVDDRTAMVGAISHDLRTPLTRLRFRLEDVSDAQRPALLREVAEMESMIHEVIAFIRDASTPGARQRLDLADLVADSIADARLVGADVELIGQVPTMVEVDPVGLRRLLSNLLENAVKYGERARVRVTLDHGEAMAEILDAGPGIPDEDMDRVFEPFYRSPEARRSGRPGSGLGLTVCRSIARAHGGDICFRHGSEGFAAVLTMPVVYDARPRLAA
ncbi:sensor histidine kinase [Novosphingobium terrae]|uniref:sensor histidine kinase n=1 Tax=Novosphingobium terrae TaxID=2726189 RepID=UPI00197F896E|nr:HAMP domain-containing sensor histidine kinase [Novosphingobium terrae]